MRVRCSLLLVASLAFTPCSALARDIDVTPATLDTALSGLMPGDTVHLAAGTYGHFTLSDLVGTAAMPIVLEGPADRSAIIRADDGPCCNTIQIDGDVSYVVLRRLTVDGHGVDGAFGVDARGPDVHHVTIEECDFIGHDASQQTVAISTKTATSGWVIRRNRIMGAGTGMYLGNSDGSDPFVEGLIEHNLIVDTIGYCMQIKWQTPHAAVPGASSGPSATILRHNVFIKTDRPSPDGDRPNVLVGGFPESGPNSEDTYQIYGNLFFHNPREALLQASGRVSIHDNVLLDGGQAGVVVTNHDLPLRRAWIYHNTIFVDGVGIRAASAGTEGVLVVANVSLGMAGGVSGVAGIDERSNVTTYADASRYFSAPTRTLGSADLYPPGGSGLSAMSVDLSLFAGDVDLDRDFDCAPRSADRGIGAYAGEGTNPGWRLAMEIKPACGTPGTDAGPGRDSGRRCFGRGRRAVDRRRRGRRDRRLRLPRRRSLWRRRGVRALPLADAVAGCCATRRACPGPSMKRRSWPGRSSSACSRWPTRSRGPKGASTKRPIRTGRSPSCARCLARTFGTSPTCCGSFRASPMRRGCAPSSCA